MRSSWAWRSWASLIEELPHLFESHPGGEDPSAVGALVDRIRLGPEFLDLSHRDVSQDVVEVAASRATHVAPLDDQGIFTTCRFRHKHRDLSVPDAMEFHPAHDGTNVLLLDSN